MPPTAKLLLLLVRAAIFAGHATGTDGCLPQERDVLLAFKQGITDDPAGRLALWRPGGDCCRWRGVRCSNLTGHVLELRLGNDESIGDLSGQITTSLFSLEHLEHLDLSWNSLDVPSDGHSSKLLGSLKSLRYLNLSGIQIGDRTLMPQLGNLSKLQYLDLSNTKISVQPTDLSWLKRLPLLHHLDLSGVDLSMVHDWPHTVNMISSLQVLYLSDCWLPNANQGLLRLSLTKLERLDLSYNYFDHPTNSCWFWNLTSLKYLNLGYNFLYGQFPNTLGQMTSLEVFDFSFNKFINHGAGGIMAPWLMRNLCNLKVLNLQQGLAYGNMTELYESLPHCSSSRLVEMDLEGNNITGTLPAGIAQFTTLVTLSLYGNYLTGHVPSEIGMLSNLTYLDLGKNNLTGVITEEFFSDLKTLEYLDLSNNSLKIVVDPDRLTPLRLKSAYFGSCQIGPGFPSWLQRLAGVSYIDLSNTGITGRFPNWFSTALSLVSSLDISDNQINGSLPENIEFMALSSLLLDRNQITGEIPPLPGYISGLSISNNALSGHIPESICKSQEFMFLDLSNNHLEGEFPKCLEMRNINFLILSNNMFTGKFPSFLRNCTDVAVLDLSGNKLYGRLPRWIGGFMKIEYLRLSYNMFSGSIPFSITSLGEMYDLNLAGNRLSGTIPRNLSNLMAMEEYPNCYRKDTSFSGMNNLPVVSKRQELYYRSPGTGIVSIDLSLNRLTGVIPEEIAFLGCMVNLNLSWNYLKGKIPNKIGSIQSLESLDLSRNKLSGEIPWSLANLTYLAWLDLSYNNLSGRIPSGSQLDTLYDSNPFIYNGNDGLCGPPLRRTCSRVNNATKLGDAVPEAMFFHIGLGSGFVVGLWVVFCTMLFNKTWRIAYFRLFDKTYDKLYVVVVVGWARLAQKTSNLIVKLG